MHLLAHHGGIAAEALLPQTVADDDAGVFVGGSPVALGEHAADDRVHAESREVVRRDNVDGHQGRLVGAVQQTSTMLVRDHRVERARLSPDVQVVHVRRWTSRMIPRRIVLAGEDADEAVGAPDWQRAQPRGVNVAEDRGIRPDAERQGDNHRGGERRRVFEHAQTVAKLLQ